MKLLTIIGFFGIAIALAGCNAQPVPGATSTTPTTTTPPVTPVRQKLSALTFDSPWIRSCVADAQFYSKIQYVDELTKLSCSGYPKGFDSFILGQSGRDSIVASTRGIEQLTALTELDLHNNYIAEIDLSSLKNLTSLNLSANVLQTLDLSRYARLKKLVIAENPLYRLILPQNGQLEVLELGTMYSNTDNFGINTLKSYLTNRKEFLTDKRFFDEQSGLLLTEASFKRLGALDFSQQNTLKILQAQSTGLTSIALNTFPINNSMEQLYLGNNALTSVDLSRLTKLQTLNLGANTIASLDLTALKALQVLDFSYNKNALAKLSAVKDNKLNSINLTGSHVSDEDLQVLFTSKTLETVQMPYTNTNFTPVSLAPNLTTLTLSGQYTSDDFAAARNLKELSLSEGSIKGLDFSKLTYLTKVTFNGTQIESGSTLTCTGRLLSLDIYTLNDAFTLNTSAQCSIANFNLAANKPLNKLDMSALNADGITITAKDTSYKNILLNGSVKNISLDGIVDLERFSFYDFPGLQSLQFANTAITSFGLKGAGGDLTSFSLKSVSLNQLSLSGNSSLISKLDFEYVTLPNLDLAPVARTLKELRLIGTTITQLDTPVLNPDIQLSIYGLRLNEKSLTNFEKATGRKLDNTGHLQPLSP